MATSAPASSAASGPRPARRTDAHDGSGDGDHAPTDGATVERVFTTVPWVEPGAVASRPAPGSSAARNGSSNGRSPAAQHSAAPPLAPAPAARPSAASSRVAAAAEPVAPAIGDSADVEAARWGPPAEHDPGGTVQFLPGRLEVLQGRSMEGQEIRFVRPDRAGERAVVTFGRGEGAPYRHVQLKVPTVSRLHARMSLEPGSDSWTLENLSATNPVAVNGVDLLEGGTPVPLSDGDRVEMGEIVFIFRAR